MNVQRKAQSDYDVKVYSDKGSLSLRFPKRHSGVWELLDGKSLKGKPKCLAIGKFGFKDCPEDWKRAEQIARAMEADLDHPEWDKLFDPTLAKYGLGNVKYAKLADVLQMPGTATVEPEMTVGEMWENYLVWKRTVIEETTFHVAFGGFSNAIYGKVWNNQGKKYLQSDLSLSVFRLDNKRELTSVLSKISLTKQSYFINELNKAFDFCKTKGMLINPSTENPFAVDKFSTPAVTTQEKYASKIVNGVKIKWHEIEDEKELENDRCAFTKEERDIIIKAFYESDKPSDRMYAPLIEFYFLTGCRTSEALPLTWKDVDFERNLIRFSKSLGVSTQKVKETKTGEARLFYFSNNSQLRKLLLNLKSESSNGLVFPSKRGRYHSLVTIGKAWLGYNLTKTLPDGTETKCDYPGVVTRLVKEEKVSSYLSLYHTRHTYITLTAHANSHNNNALLHIATSCGNSVDVILRHYLGVNEATEVAEV